MDRPDILLVMSDQHAGYYMGHEGGMVDTPCMDALAAEGTRFANHYTSCPLCVPARMSFLSGRLPTRVGVTNNNQTLAETDPTWLFPMVEAGYETVLIGRMHFIGKDQRHGFTKRIGGDMTPTCWAPQYQKMAQERGGKDMVRAFASHGCLNVIGSGESPVRTYDDVVTENAIEYLAQPHEKPQCIVVGTFGPHFPYVADPALYRKYQQRGYLPASFADTPDFVTQNPWLKAHCKEVDETEARNAAAAYCALIEESDAKLGRILDAFKQYTRKTGHRAIYGYTSDHGDTVGARHMYGKQTFFEDSARVPLLLAGDDIPIGFTVCNNTSIMDIGPTLCELAGLKYEGRFVDGISLCELMRNSELPNTRPILSQYIESRGGGPRDPNGKTELSYAVMVRRGDWKFVEYHGCAEQATLFNLQEDSGETKNLCSEQPQLVAALREIALSVADPCTVEMEHADRVQMYSWLKAYENTVGSDDAERWKGELKNAPSLEQNAQENA